MVREVSALAALAHEVDVVCLRKEGEPRRERDGRVTVWRLPMRHRRGTRVVPYLVEYGMFFLMATSLVTALHLRRRFRLVQVNSPPDVLVLCSAVPRLLGARVLLDLQECLPEFFATKFSTSMDHPAVRLIARLEQFSIRYADLVITPTRQMRATFVARGGDPKKITVVMDGADEDVFTEADAPGEAGDSGGFRLISHGTVEEYYGLDTVIEAVALLRDAIPELRFDVYGDGTDLDRLTQLAQKLGVEEFVHFTGEFVPLDDLVRAIARSDAGVVAIKRDPFRDLTLTNKMFDFIAMRKPVIASRTRSVEETFDSSCIELFESGNAEDLARAIRAVYDDPERRGRMVERAAEIAEGYQWAEQREVYRDAVERLLGRVERSAPARAG